MAKRSQEEKSAIVSGAGFAAALWIAVEVAVRKAGGSDEDIHRLGTEEGKDTLCKMARVVVLRGKCEISVPESAVVPATPPSPATPPTPSTYQVTVDHGQTLEEMIAAGRYDMRKNYITAEHFPVQGTGKVDVELHLVHLNRSASTNTVLAELDRRNLRPATLPDLLAFGAKYHNIQKDFPIVALGSVWQDRYGRRIVAGLELWDGGRALGLFWIEGGWGGRYRFLAARK